MIPPRAIGYTIYSKPDCVYCDKAKQLIKGVEISIEKDYPSFLEFILPYTKRDYRLFPMIFFDGEFIGGFEEARTHHESLRSYEVEQDDF